tara:strand:+ start:2224 stop:3153 length:930 start_codon:yes stop_codon:yes gene_type:complete
MQEHNSVPLSVERLNSSLNRAPVAPPPQLKRQQICTIGAPDAYRTDYRTVCEVPVPEPELHPRSGNASYQPVPYASLIDGARDAMANVLDAEPVFETYALNKKGSQLFGMIGFGSGLTGQAITVALRSSYDKTISNQVAIGSAPFVCANGCFSGEHMVSAKHTTNVFSNLGNMLDDITDTAVTPVLERIRMIEGWRDIPVQNDLFGAYMGVLFSRGLIKPNSFNAAFRYWNDCHTGDLHNEHGTFDLYSAYQAVTAAGQRTPPNQAFRHFAGIDHATKAIAAAGGSVTDAHIPAFDLSIREYVDVGEAK